MMQHALRLYRRTGSSGLAACLFVGIIAGFCACFEGRGIATAQEMTWIAGNGNWSVSANWDPQNVPDVPGESALIPLGTGSSAITLDVNPSIDRLRVLDPAAMLLLGGSTIWIGGSEGLVNHGTLRANGNANFVAHLDNAASGRLVIETGRTVYMSHPTCRNDGVILVNETGTGNAGLDVYNHVLLYGSGDLVLNGDDAGDGIWSTWAYTLTQSAGHTTRGFGVLAAPFVNQGIVDADRPGGFLRLSQNHKYNSGVLRASAGGELQIQGIELYNQGGMIVADGGDVVLAGAAVHGGTISRSGASVVRSHGAALREVAIASGGQIDVPSGYGLGFRGGSLVNDGVIRLNDTGEGDSWIDVQDHAVLAGNGQILLNGDDGGDQIMSTWGYTLTQSAGHTIRGSGGIAAPFVNQGVVDADRAGGFLGLSHNHKHNSGVLRASAGGELWIQGIELYNQGGMIAADGGDVVLAGATVHGGTISRSGASVVRSQGGAVREVAIASGGQIDVSSGYGLGLQGTSLVNDGVIRLNDTGEGDSWIDLQNYVVVSGGGDILLNGDDGGDQIMTTWGYTLTQSEGHTIRGFGRIAAPFVNHGVVDADRAGGFLRLSDNPKTNTGLLRASNGGELRIDGIPLYNAEGEVIASGGDIVLSNATLSGGTADCAGTSVIRSRNGTIQDVTVAPGGRIDVPSGYGLGLRGGSLVNDGVIRLNDTGEGNSWIDLQDHVVLAGNGRILLNGDDGGDRIMTTWGYGLTQQQGHTIHGKGDIVCNFTNRGTVRADSSVYRLRVDTGYFHNLGECEAANGARLEIQQLPLNYGSRMLSGGAWTARAQSRIVLNNAPVDTIDARVLLDGPGARIDRDGSGQDALAGLSRITSAGEFAIGGGRNFAAAGDLLVRGRLNVAGACTLDVPGSLTTRLGRIVVDGVLRSANPITVDTGRLSGCGILAASLVNSSGWIQPGSSAGRLRVTGDFTQDASGWTVIEIGGRTPDRYDHLQIDGHATLAGRLELAAIDGHTVLPGDEYTILTFGSRDGEFDHIANSCLAPGVCFDVVYNPNDITLIAYQVSPSGIEDDAASQVEAPAALRLHAPEGGKGVLLLDLPEAARVDVSVYDVTGREVAGVISSDLPAGAHALRWDARAIRSGVYFARALVRRDGRVTTKTERVWIVR